MHAKEIYELAGDASYSPSEFAAKIARPFGKAAACQNFPEAGCCNILIETELSAPRANLLADSDVGPQQRPCVKTDGSSVA